MLTFNSIKKSIFDITSYGLVARILIFFKGILLAYFVGANYKMDTYLVAFSATLLATKIISDGLTVSLVPTLQEIDKRDGLKGRNDFTNNMVNSFILFSLVLMVIGYIIAPIVIKLMGPGFIGEERKEAVYLFRLGLPIMTFHFLRAIGGGYLQSIHKFKAGAKSGVINPIIYILYLVTFGHYFGLKGLMIAGTIAVAGQAYILYQGCVKSGYKYKFYIFLKDRRINRVFSFLLPIVVGLGINEVNAVVDNAVGSILEPGTIAHLSYANDITGLFVGIFIFAIVTAIYPILAEGFNKNKMDDLNNAINYSFKFLILIIIPLTIVLIALAEPIVRLFYERGAFGVSNTYNTARILVHYSSGLLGTGFVLLLVRIYYAIHDTDTPMILSAIALSLNLVLDIVLAKFFGAIGIALGTSLSLIITSFIGILILDRKLDFISWDKIPGKFLKLFYASFVMISVIFTIKVNFAHMLSGTFIGELFFVTVVSVMGIATFGLVIFAFKLQGGIFDYK